MDTLTFERSSALPIELTQFRARIQRIVELTVAEVNRSSNERQVDISKTEEVDNRETFWLIFELRGLTRELRARFDTLLAKKLSDASIVWSLEQRHPDASMLTRHLLGSTARTTFDHRIETKPDIINRPPQIAMPKESPTTPHWMQLNQLRYRCR